MDVWDDSSAGDGSLDECVELLVPPDSELEVPGRHRLLPQVVGRVPSELEDLGSQVLEDAGHVDRGIGVDFPVAAAVRLHLLEHADNVDLEAGAGRLGDELPLGLLVLLGFTPSSGLGGAGTIIVLGDQVPSLSGGVFPSLAGHLHLR